MVYRVELGRFIPARAGNTNDSFYRVSFGPVHPRPRGEHYAVSLRYSLCTGSSPPARGTRVSIRAGHHQHRFIPARAGNTSRARARRSRTSVHPRPRGEHLADPDRLRDFPGSSPPARGTLVIGRLSFVSFRFIPARAGNTRAGGSVLLVVAVHPRPRGEHFGMGVVVGRWAGSSPPARGTPHGGCARYVGPRFIPARAGNTARCSASSSRRSVHPRPRGEHRSRRYCASGATGSSPPARGTLFPQDIDSKGVAAHHRPHQLRSPDPGEEAMARSRRVAPRFQLVPRWAVAARIARA